MFTASLKQIALIGFSLVITLSHLQSSQVHDQPPVTPHQAPAPAPLETQTRGIYNSFQDSFKFVSPDNAMLVLAEMITNARFKGRYGPQKPQFLCHYQITHPAEGHQPTNAIDCPQDQTSAIIQHHFPSPAGGILRIPALDKIDLIARMDINAIGELLKIYVLYKTHMTEARTDAEKERVRQASYQDFKFFFETRLKNLEKDKGAQKSLSEQWQKAGIFLNQLPEHYATMFTQAYFEQNHYPVHLVEYTLLAYIWKKASKREQILNLINGPLKGFTQQKPKDSGQKIAKTPPFSEALYWQWKNEAVGNHQLIPHKFQEWLQDPEKLIFMTIGYQLFENQYPKMLDFGDAIYNSPTGKIAFRDCGETSLKNFINFMISVASLKRFEVEILTTAFPHVKPEVIKFYNTIQPSFIDVLGSEKDRNAWANSISGLDPAKVIYRDKVCNLKGVGIDNMLAALAEIFGDEELKSITSKNIEEQRALKFEYIINKFNEVRSDVRVTWSENGQSQRLSDYPTIILKVNDLSVFEWKFITDHFTFLPISNPMASANWLLNSNVGFESILHSALPDQLKRLLLPFYTEPNTISDFISHPLNKQALTGYAYEFLFSGSMTGNEHTLNFLHIALSLNSADPSLISLVKSIIRKSFNHPDIAGDRMLIAFLYQHREAFGAQPIHEDFGDRISQLYEHFIKPVPPIKDSQISSWMDSATEMINKPFGAPYTLHMLHKIKEFSPQYLGSVSAWRIAGDIARKGSVDMLDVLMKNGENWSKLLKDQKGLLDTACGSNNLPIVEALINDQPTRDFLLDPKHIKGINKSTPLHTASKSLSVIKFLLENPFTRQALLRPENLKDGSGNTPLHDAATHGSLSTISVLLSDQELRKLLLGHDYIKNNGGETPLSEGCSYGRLETVKALLDDPEAINIQLKPENLKDKEGLTALHFACMSGILSVVQALLNNTGVKNILLSQENLKDHQGRTPLHLASTRRNVYTSLENISSVLKALLRNSETRKILLTQENIKDNDSHTPLAYACAGGYLPIVNDFLNDPEAIKILVSPENIESSNPLLYACEEGHVSVVEALLKNVEVRTPLVKALPQEIAFNEGAENELINLFKRYPETSHWLQTSKAN